MFQWVPYVPRGCFGCSQNIDGNVSLQPSINTTNIDTLLVATDQTERIVEPPENVQEKIAFIFNNLSQSNMTQKVNYRVYNANLKLL